MIMCPLVLGRLNHQVNDNVRPRPNSIHPAPRRPQCPGASFWRIRGQSGGNMCYFRIAHRSDQCFPQLPPPPSLSIPSLRVEVMRCVSRGIAPGPTPSRWRHVLDNVSVAVSDTDSRRSVAGCAEDHPRKHDGNMAASWHALCGTAPDASVRDLTALYYAPTGNKFSVVLRPLQFFFPFFSLPFSTSPNSLPGFASTKRVSGLTTAQNRWAKNSLIVATFC
ncbi:hypothetical protein B0T22DRAFT_62460 [Podospora appendiculata]|uniref:Uncharacterized protein n=1 Tax=Podospora appendiculata TaxID=314037 RepID=A0AAE0XIK4_9PEZI|nr:hypothetical protein B0T22DRAFT_243852 [Podospora appendiculata]KAK3694123.1 hypothetical protein B0T22DRAFT_62460 [Podospora appendiculata]